MGKSWKRAGTLINAQKKGAQFTKLAREIAVAAKLGGPDLNGNARLRIAIEAARKVSCPKDTIDRAIKKGTGQLDGDYVMEELMYEGFGPHNVGILVVCQTENRNRTASEIKHIFSKNKGNPGEPGSVSWMFEKIGKVIGSKENIEDIEEEAIEGGANEVEQAETEQAEENNNWIFYTDTSEVDQVRKNLSERGWEITTAELAYRPTQISEINEEQKEEVIEVLKKLDDHDDVSRLYVSINDF